MREKHPLWIRIVHWLNVPFLALMAWSGLLIYWANGIYPGFFPDWFYDLFQLKFRLAEGLMVHFTVAWLLVLNGLVYLVFTLFTRHRRELFPNRAAARDLLPTIQHDLGLRASAPTHGKFNAAQRFAYTGALVLLALEVLSGFAIYKPVQLGFLTTLFGGYEGARLVHFGCLIVLVLFTLLHLVQVLRAGWSNFRSMVSGHEENE